MCSIVLFFMSVVRLYVLDYFYVRHAFFAILGRTCMVMESADFIRYIGVCNSYLTRLYFVLYKRGVY